jgi:hypothetical protein
MGLGQSSRLLAPLTGHRNQLCCLSKVPGDERASSVSTAISLFHLTGFRVPNPKVKETLVLTSPRSRAILKSLDFLVDIGVPAEKEVIQ